MEKYAFLSDKKLFTHEKIALITGVTGQDGSFLAEFLLEKVTTYTVLSAVRQ